MFKTTKETPFWKTHTIHIPPPPPKEVLKIRQMLSQAEVWINSGEKELAEKHWALISSECLKYSESSL